MTPPPTPSETIHATCVRIHNQAALILGASGSGKSSLALQLIGLGAQLIADDRTTLTCDGNAVIASCPDTIAGLIEARGVGILRVSPVGPTPVALAIDLDRSETARLPEPHFHAVLGQQIPCLWHAPSPHFAPAILQYLTGGVRP